MVLAASSAFLGGDTARIERAVLRSSWSLLQRSRLSTRSFSALAYRAGRGREEKGGPENVSLNTQPAQHKKRHARSTVTSTKNAPASAQTHAAPFHGYPAAPAALPPRAKCPRPLVAYRTGAASKHCGAMAQSPAVVRRRAHATRASCRCYPGRDETKRRRRRRRRDRRRHRQRALLSARLADCAAVAPAAHPRPRRATVRACSRLGRASRTAPAPPAPL